MAKTKAELLEARSNNLEERAKIIKAAGDEKRNLTAEEVARLEEIRSANALIDAQIDEIEEQRKKDEEEARKKNPKPTENREKQVSLTKLLRGIATGNMDDETRAVFAKGSDEFRASGISDFNGFAVPTESRATLTTVEGAKLIETEKKGIIDPLMQNLIFASLGANISTGLKGNIEFIKGKSFQANWKGETAKADEASLSFDTVEFKPKRLAVTVPVSMQLLMQDSLGVEEYLRRMIILAIQTKLENTAFGVGALGDSPKGLFNGTIANKGVMSYDRAVDCIASLDKANALMGNLGFVTSPVGFSICAKTPFAEGKDKGYLTDYREQNLLGYGVKRTTAVPDNLNTSESGLLFANWADFFVGQWGGLAITADSVTRADEGIVRFIVNTWWDFGFINDESKVVASIKAK